MNISRREMGLLLPALLAAAPGYSAPRDVLPARAYPFESLTAHTHTGHKSWDVLNGLNHSGFRIELHETELEPGAQPHPPHRHVHEEIFLIRQGYLEVTMAGKSTRLGPGSVAYVASNVLHGIKNTSHSNAAYFVIALGTDEASSPARS